MTRNSLLAKLERQCRWQAGPCVSRAEEGDPFKSAQHLPAWRCSWFI